MGFTDDRPVSYGVQNKTGTRSAPTVINSAYNELQFWDGRAPSLEKQAMATIRDRAAQALRLKSHNDCTP
jgi:cytochrome c peroxidase